LKIRFARGARLALLAVVTAIAPSLAILGWSSSPAAAHCPSTPPNYHEYVSGGNNNNVVKSVKVTIGWVNSPAVCSSGVSHSITICQTGSCPGWMQVGWRYYAGYSKPKAYCERKPSNGNAYTLNEYSVSSESHNYAIVRTSSNLFECRIDGDTKEATVTSYVGFSSGTWVPVQSEAHSPHVQLGHVAPNWMVFKDAVRINTSQSSYVDLNLSGVGSGDPVWNFQQPQSTGFWVNTDANH
jgi:hypothetical protein